MYLATLLEKHRIGNNDMNKTAIIMLIVGLVGGAGGTYLVATGISSVSTEEIKTISYYEAHPEERDAKIKECRDNPGELGDTPNCINSRQAVEIRVKTPDW